MADEIKQGIYLMGIIEDFIENNVIDDGGNCLIKEIIYENKIPTKNPILIIKYPIQNITWEGNIISKTWTFELYLVSPVTINIGIVYEKLEPILDKIIEEIKAEPQLGSTDIYLCDIGERIEPGSLTYSVNKTNYEYVGFKFNLIFYNWDV